MTEEKIIEILHRYNSFYHGETIWFFSKEEILDFARALIEARFSEDDDEPVTWMEFDGEGGYDFYPYRGNEGFQKEFLEGNPSSTYRDWVQPLYSRPQPKARLTDEEIRDIMLANGFTIKDGCEDLKPYVYAAVRAIEQKIWGNSE